MTTAATAGQSQVATGRDAWSPGASSLACSARPVSVATILSASRRSGSFSGAGAAGPAKIGLRMGLWGAAQAVAFGLGGFAGTAAVDLLRAVSGSVPIAYGGVFLFEGTIFLAAAAIALGVASVRTLRPPLGGVHPRSGLQAAE